MTTVIEILTAPGSRVLSELQETVADLAKYGLVTPADLARINALQSDIETPDEASGVKQ